MTPQGVHAHRALLDQQFAGLVRHQRGLLVFALDGDETHVRPRHRLADRRRIRRVVLAALDIGFHVIGGWFTSWPIARNRRAQ